jgi:mannonate dehydratase
MIKDQMALEPGLKIAAQMSPEATEDDFAFVNQMGIKYAVLWTGADKASAGYYASAKKRFAGHGITVYGFGNRDVHNQDAITLGLENREAKIAQYKQHLRDLGAAGVPYTTYAHMANGIWSTERETTRGGAPARAFNLVKADKGHWAGKYFPVPLSHGRKYSKEEIWENYTHFIKAVVPVAEELGIRIGIHPDDPPVPELAGVPRCIFGNFEGYVRALEIAGSPNIGVCLCAGTWLEGGPLMGKDVVEAIRYFGRRGKLWKIHFRNVSAPLPYFVETFVDNGYMDMYKVMKALHEVDFRGAVIADHVPAMVGGRLTGWAYSIGYIKALRHAATA